MEPENKNEYEKQLAMHQEQQEKIRQEIEA